MCLCVPFLNDKHFLDCLAFSYELSVWLFSCGPVLFLFFQYVLSNSMRLCFSLEISLQEIGKLEEGKEAEQPPLPQLQWGFLSMTSKNLFFFTLCSWFIIVKGISQFLPSSQSLPYSVLPLSLYLSPLPSPLPLCLITLLFTWHFWPFHCSAGSQAVKPSQGEGCKSVSPSQEISWSSADSTKPSWCGRPNVSHTRTCTHTHTHTHWA